MAINLKKGFSEQLNMNVFHVGLGWDVNDGASPFDFDLDVSAFMLGYNKKTITEDYLVFYNSDNRLKVDACEITPKANERRWVGTKELIKPLAILKSMHWGIDNDAMRNESRPVDPEMSVIGSLDDEDGETSLDGDDEVMDIDLSKVRPEVQEIIITVSIHEAEQRKQNFGQVERAYVRLYKPGRDKEGQEEYRYDLTEDFSACHSIEFCRLYRNGSSWDIQALGIGHHGGLEELVEKYVYAV